MAHVRLSHRKHSMRLCVYVAASDTYLAGIVTQVPSTDASLDHTYKRHEPLAFLSGHSLTLSCAVVRLKWELSMLYLPLIMPIGLNPT